MGIFSPDAIRGGVLYIVKGEYIVFSIQIPQNAYAPPIPGNGAGRYQSVFSVLNVGSGQ